MGALQSLRFAAPHSTISLPWYPQHLNCLFARRRRSPQAHKIIKECWLVYASAWARGDLSASQTRGATVFVLGAINSPLVNAKVARSTCAQVTRGHASTLCHLQPSSLLLAKRASPYCKMRGFTCLASKCKGLLGPVSQCLGVMMVPPRRNAKTSTWKSGCLPGGPVHSSMTHCGDR